MDARTHYALTIETHRPPQGGFRMATLTDNQLNQALTVEHWREEVLTQAGYPKAVARVLAAGLDIDLHHAVELLEAGCPPATALRILL